MSSASGSGTGTSAADSANRDSSKVSNHWAGDDQWRFEVEEGSLKSLKMVEFKFSLNVLVGFGQFRLG
jgi:hypothetical protein